MRLTRDEFAHARTERVNEGSVKPPQTDLAWLRQVEKVATAEGLKAAQERERDLYYGSLGNGLNRNETFAYYNWERGTQILVQINRVTSHDGKTWIEEKDQPFTVTVTEYSLKDPNGG